MLPTEPRVNTSDSASSIGDALPPDAVRRVHDLGGGDLLVGIPCFDNADTVGHVATAVEAGLRKHFPERRAVICASDGGSTDGTREVFLGSEVGERAETYLVPADTTVPAKLCFEYGGPSGKGSAILAIFEVARRLRVGACAVVDADLRSITPYWIDRLLSPVVHYRYEFVTPLYARHKHDGTITNALAYPLTTALYGARIRQPIGGEFGFSGEMAGRFARGDVSGSEVARFGIDAWLTTTAVIEDRRICQAIMGAKLHDPKDPGADLAPMFRQVVGTLFDLAGSHRDRWWTVEGASAPPRLGFPSAFGVEPVEVSLDGLARGFAEGRAEHGERWADVLSEDSIDAVKALPDDAPALDAEGWFRVLYDYLVAYQLEADRAALLDSLVPLYFARTFAFVDDTADDEEEEAEAKVEAAVDTAVALKPYLRERWAAEAPAAG
jgi:glucosylglycerate synthase